MKTNFVRILSLVLMVAIVFLSLLFTNSQHIEINVDGAFDKLQVELGSEFAPPSASAHYTSLFTPNGEEVAVTVNGTVDTSKVGVYTLEYIADNAGEQTKKYITIEVKDLTPPTITLVTNSKYTSPVAKYQEEGFTAIDNYDGDITANVVRTETHDKVTYSVTDSSGNSTTVERQIIYKDVIAPKITLNGGENITATIGEAYSEKGFKATDEVDGDLTSKVVVSGTVDTSKSGSSKLTYTVSDSAGNKTTVTRTIFVVGPQTEYQIINPGDKVVYLTFDDGPSAYTEKLLSVLAKYNVKATFFVTGANGSSGKYRYMLKKEAAQGHTVAVHTYTHNWNVYSSVDAFHNDIEKMNDIIEQETGKRTNILRFPGGSGNTVSKKYCKGVMTALTAQVGSWGYRYFDWNVASGDTGGTTSSDQVYRNVIGGIAKCGNSGKPAVVLQHDIKSYSVDAVERIIQWGISNGYTFLPLTENSPNCHASVKN